MESPRHQLADLARLPDAAIDLPRAALLVSALFQPDLDLGLHLRRLESLAIAAVASVPRGLDQSRRVHELNRFLFEQEGFGPNLEDYYDPRNSFLDQVLERRVGIPISLALVYVEVARQVGLPALGVGFPGHFLVRVGQGDSIGFLDPFGAGAALDEDELDLRLASIFGQGVRSVRTEPSLLRPSSQRAILVRLLSNLKGIFTRDGKLERVLTAVDAILVLAPDLPEALRDRGLVYSQLGHASAALADLRRYVELTDNGEEIAALMPVIDQLEAGSVRLH